MLWFGRSGARTTSLVPARRLNPAADFLLDSSTVCTSYWDLCVNGLLIFCVFCSSVVGTLKCRSASLGLCVGTAVVLLLLALPPDGFIFGVQGDRRCRSKSNPGEAPPARTPQPEPRFEIVTFSSQSRYTRVVSDGLAVRRSRVVNETAAEPVYIRVNEEAVVSADGGSRFSFVSCLLEPSTTRGNSGHIVLDARCVRKSLEPTEKLVKHQVASRPSPFDFRFRCTQEWLQARQLAWETALDTGATDAQKLHGYLTPEGVGDHVREHSGSRWFAFASIRTPNQQLMPVYCSDESPLFTVVGRDTRGDVWVPSGYRVALAEGVSGEFTVCRRGLCAREVVHGMANSANTCLGSKADCTADVSGGIPEAIYAARGRKASSGLDQSTEDRRRADRAEELTPAGSKGETPIEAKPHLAVTGVPGQEERRRTENGPEIADGRRKGNFQENGDLSTTNADDSGNTVTGEAVRAGVSASSSVAGGRGAVEVTCTPNFGFYVDPLQDPQTHAGRKYYLLGQTLSARIFCEEGYDRSPSSGSQSGFWLAGLLACFTASVF